jgi:hypothetical protein
MPSSSSLTRVMSEDFTLAMAMMSTLALEHLMTCRRFVILPDTGTELMRRCFFAGSSSIRATGRYGESLSCTIWVMRVLARNPAPYTTACGACALGFDLDSTYMRFR